MMLAPMLAPAPLEAPILELVSALPSMLVQARALVLPRASACVLTSVPESALALV